MLRRFLNLFERNTSDDSLDFTVLLIMPFGESFKWNKSFFYLNLLDSLLIYPAVWLTFCRGLPLTGSELHGNPYFFIFYKPGLFFINALSLGNNLYSGMKKKTLTWFLWCKKIWKELVCHRSLRLPSLATSLEFFAFTLLPFLHISEDSRIILRFLNPFVM